MIQSDWDGQRQDEKEDDNDDVGDDENEDDGDLDDGDWERDEDILSPPMMTLMKRGPHRMVNWSRWIVRRIHRRGNSSETSFKWDDMSVENPAGPAR